MEIKTPGNIGHMNLTTLHWWYPLFENAGQEQLSAALPTKILETMTHILAKQRTYALACIKYTATVITDISSQKHFESPESLDSYEVFGPRSPKKVSLNGKSTNFKLCFCQYTGVLHTRLSTANTAAGKEVNHSTGK